MTVLSCRSITEEEKRCAAADSVVGSQQLDDGSCVNGGDLSPAPVQSPNGSEVNGVEGRTSSRSPNKAKVACKFLQDKLYTVQLLQEEQDIKIIQDVPVSCLQ